MEYCLDGGKYKTNARSIEKVKAWGREYISRLLIPQLGSSKPKYTTELKSSEILQLDIERVHMVNQLIVFWELPEVK